MKNEEIRKGAELSDEALDEVSGGVMPRLMRSAPGTMGPATLEMNGSNGIPAGQVPATTLELMQNAGKSIGQALTVPLEWMGQGGSFAPKQC